MEGQHSFGNGWTQVRMPIPYRMKWILSVLVLGAVAGALGRYLMPGPDKGSWPWTIGLGIVGSLVGGLVALLIPFFEISYRDPISIMTIAFSTVGAVILLAVRRVILKKQQVLGGSDPLETRARQTRDS